VGTARIEIGETETRNLCLCVASIYFVLVKKVCQPVREDSFRFLLAKRI
jgi:hypothetical protein